MATIRKRCSGWNVQICKKGYPPLTRSFKDRSTALSWAKKVESEIDRYIYLDISVAQTTTVNEVLNRFSNVVLIQRYGHHNHCPHQLHAEDSYNMVTLLHASRLIPCCLQGNKKVSFQRIATMGR